MATFDFIGAKLKHSSWKMKTRAFIDGREPMNENEAVSHRDCELGKWLYSEGLKQYGNIPEMSELERVHEGLHNNVRAIISKKKAGDDEGAEEAYRELSAASAKILAMLDTIKRKVS
jgi:methyl-accepting chemotaxis protein